MMAPMPYQNPCCTNVMTMPAAAAIAAVMATAYITQLDTLAAQFSNVSPKSSMASLKRCQPDRVSKVRELVKRPERGSKSRGKV